VVSRSAKYVCTRIRFLADRTNGRAIGTTDVYIYSSGYRTDWYSVASVCLSFVTLCIVAKRCVLEQKLLL